MTGLGTAPAGLAGQAPHEERLVTPAWQRVARAFAAYTGKPLWRIELPGNAKSLAGGACVLDGTMFFSCGQTWGKGAGGTVAVEPKTGKVLWKKEQVGYFHAGVIRTGDGKLLVLSDAGQLSLLEVDDKGAKEVCKAKVCGGTLVTPALAGGRLYARDGKELSCVELPK